MADGLSMTEAMQSYRTAVEAPQWQQESKDRASLLATQAEQHRMILNDAKEQAQQRLSYLAGKKDVGMENPTLNPANLGQAIQLQDALINKYKQQPELQQYAIKEKDNLLKQQQEALKLQGMQREQSRAELYDVLSEATTNPASAAQLATSNDPRLQHFGQLLSSQKPVFFGGRQVLFKDLDLPAQKEVVSRILSPIAPKLDARKLAEQSELELKYQRLQEEEETKRQRIRAEEQDTAARRERQQQKEEQRKTEKENRDKEYLKAKAEYGKQIAAIDTEIAKYENMTWLTSNEKAALSIAKGRKAEIEDTWVKAQELYGKKDVDVKTTTKGAGTKENPIKLD